MKPARFAWFVVAALIVGAGCASKKKPPPEKKAEPKMCAVVERGSDIVLSERQCADADTDQDGVDDAVDICPGHAETQNGVADGDGCPDPDLDEDMFLDFEDACPDKKGGFPDGCPTPDSDGDGLADHLDACPSRPEDVDGEYDTDGCPEGERKLRDNERLVTWKVNKVQVRRGKARPTEDGARTIAELVDGVEERVSAIVKVHIVGWAGVREVRRGRARKLARERVELVRDAFMSAGLPPSRFDLDARPLRGKKSRKTGFIEVAVMVAELKPGAESEEGGTADAGTPAETAPAESKPAESRPAESKPAESKPTESKPAESKPAESAPTESKPAETKPERSEPAKDPPKPAEGSPPPPSEDPPPIDDGDDDDWDAAVLGQ